MRLGFLLALVPLLACAEAVPQDALDRCKLGTADPNDGYVMRQGAACRVVAQALVKDEKPSSALSYARRACDLEDPSGCVLYLALAHDHPEELSRARATGEKACDGMVVSASGDDPRARLCFATAELYDELQPRSADDAGRLYAMACKLGDARGCPRAHALGADTASRSTAAAKPAPPPPPSAAAATSTSTVVSTVLAPACHDMRDCVTLEVVQRDGTQAVGTLTNHCAGAVTCRWCPAHGGQVDKNGCHSGTLNAGEMRMGDGWGLAYPGYDSIAYDCMEDKDMPGCLGGL